MAMRFDAGVEDVEAVLAAGEKLREHGPYGVLVGDETFRFNPVVIADPIPTGAQILAAAGIRQPVEHLLFQMLNDGQLEEIRPEETTDLRTAGAERFLVFRSDRSYRILLDDRAFDWGAQHINGATLKALAGVDSDDIDVWQVVVGGDDCLIDNREYVDLNQPGVERFATKPFAVTIIVNARKRAVTKRRVSYWEIVKMAFPDAQPDPLKVYTVNYDHGPHQNPEGWLVEGQTVKVKEEMTFYVTFTDKS